MGKTTCKRIIDSGGKIMYKSISQEQFLFAENIIGKALDLRDVRERMISQGVIKKDLAYPSEIWQSTIEHYDYALNPTYDVKAANPAIAVAIAIVARVLFLFSL